MKSLRALLFLVSVFVICGCGGRPPLNLSVIQPTATDTETVSVVPDCSYLYDTKIWEVAVLEFANNTGYGDMSIGGSSATGVAASQTVSAAVGAGSRDRRGNSVGAAVGASQTVAAYSSNSSEFMGQFAPSLGTFAQSVVEETLVQMGGVSLVNRSYMDKIMQEQQFQMAVADPNSIMQFGKLAGVKYVVTGSVDNIQAKYVAPTAIKGDNSQAGTIIAAISAGIDAVASGWFVSTTVTITMIDAETGKIIYSKAIDGKQRATQSAVFQPDLVINTAKKIMSDAVKNARTELSNIFEMNGYINEMRGGKQVAQINLGTKNGIRKGDIMEVYGVHVSTDFLTKETKCGLVSVGVKMEMSEQISETSSWGYLIGDPENLKNVKIGSHVKRVAVAK